jgi:hypothetical protein
MQGDTLDSDALLLGSRQKAQPDCWYLPDPSDPDLWSGDVQDLLFSELPDHAQAPLASALGDRRSSNMVRSAVMAAPNEWRGWVARLFHLRFIEGVGPRHQHRAALEDVWEHDHAAAGMAAGSRSALRQMFVDAGFRVPKRLGQPVTLWRGLSMDHPRLRRGVSWSTDKRVAAWFAMIFGPRTGSPVVLRCEVPRAAVLHWSDERKEREAVCFETDGAVLDGDPAEWARLAAEHRT